MQSAAQELWNLHPYGLQLTPGNAPDPKFREWLAKNHVHYMTHHGFTWHALRQNVWCPSGTCLVPSRSVHPPQTKYLQADCWSEVLTRHAETRTLPILETMYPGYFFGTGVEIDQAMDMNIALAVDASHIYMQKHLNLMTERTWKRLQNYSFIQEIHISSNLGTRDSHTPIEAQTFGLAWAKERSLEIPLVLECYMHKLSLAQRCDQMGLLLS